MNESMRKIVYYENILEFKQNTKSELHLSEVNNWELCRTCLVESKEGDWDLEKMCVMDAFEGRFLNVQEMLRKVTTIQINEGDELPLKICKDCMEKLMTLYFFSIQVGKADKVLKNLSLKLRGEKGGAVKDTTTQSTNMPEGRRSNRDSKEEYADSNESVVHTDEVVEEVLKSPTITKKIEFSKKQDENTSVTLDEGEDAKNVEASAKTLKLSKEQEESSAPIVDEQNCDDDKKESDDDVFSKKPPKCESPSAIETTMDSHETILMEVEEGFQEFRNNDFEFDISQAADEALYENENVATVEIYLNDEQEEHLDEEEIENMEGDDVEIVVPNTLNFNQTKSINRAEPIRITKAFRKASDKPTHKSLFKHKQKRVTKPLLESRKCDVCQMSFKLQRDLVAHVKEQHPNCKAYQCRECGQLFSYTQSLSRHMNTHKDELHKNICSYCPKAFLRPDDLIRHIRTHTGERPYKCPKCDKAFKQQGEMKQHLTTHLERRAYECDQCFCVLTSRNSLYLHKKSRHSNKSCNDQQFKCSHCAQSFKSEVDLLDHETRLHDMEKVDDSSVWHEVVEE